ncbi:MAG: alpha-2-macroglobulin family protein, partial [Verrucomicrobiae bacterium]|nr:alpha-2-macroglobulin family protein [Verrucomicrobiae bacterium]
KPDGELAYIRRGAARSVQWIAVNPALEKIALSGLELRIVERRTLAVLSKRVDGNYAYDSVVKEIPVRAEPLAIAAAGTSWKVPSETPGDYVARILDSKETILAQAAFTIAGEANLLGAFEKNAELQLRIPKGPFRAGEEIELQIVAPYAGAGLITLEHDRVAAFRWFKTTTTSTVQRIRIPDDFEGNGYVNVAFSRALDSREIFANPLSVAVAPFEVTRARRRLDVALEAPEAIRPGEILKIRARADRSVRAVVFAVDEGILQAARYGTPDPLGFFFQKRALQVETLQILDLVLPEFSIVRAVSAPGGDGGAELIARHLNPFKRRGEPPVAFWSGLVDLGPQDRVFEFSVPDSFHGAVRVMAVAADSKGAGSCDLIARVKGPLVIDANAPGFVAPGDRFEATIAIANATEPAAPLSIELAAETRGGLKILDGPPSKLEIAPREEKVLRVNLEATDALGNADIIVRAAANGMTVPCTAHLGVRPSTAHRITLASGSFGDSTHEVPLERSLFAAHREVLATISPGPLGFAQGLREYLLEYPYGCTEQLVSRGFPALVLSDRLEFGLTKEESERQVQAVFARLAERQNDQGAFGYWRPDDACGSDLPTLHAAHFLTEASERGHEIPDSMLERTLERLEKIGASTPESLEEARDKACALYLLARNGRVVTNDMVHLREWLDSRPELEWKKDLASVYLGCAYALLQDEEQGLALVRGFEGCRKERVETEFEDALDLSAMRIYLVARHFPADLARLKPA